MKITLTKLSTEELATLAERVISSSKSGKYTVVENHPLLQQIEKEYADYSKVYEKSTYSGKGSKVAAADHKRDRIFAGIKLYLKGYGSLEYLPNYEDANELYAVIKRLGLGLDKLSYAKETAKMKILLEELDSEPNKTKIKALNLETAIEEFKSANELFKTLYSEQAEANSDLRSLPSASVIRRNLTAALKNYFFILEGMKTVDEWKAIYGDINEIVKGIQ